MKNFISMGITVKCDIENNWLAECEYTGGSRLDGSFMQGTINTYFYQTTLEQAINRIMESIQLLGIRQCNEVSSENFALYCLDSHCSEETLNQLKNEANKRGWELFIEE